MFIHSGIFLGFKKYQINVKENIQNTIGKFYSETIT